MKKFLILFLAFLLIGAKNPDSLELRIFNDSKFVIENLKINFNGQQTEFKNIKPKTYSDVKKVEGLWKDNCYDLTIFKKGLLGFRIHHTCMPIDHIGDNKIEHGKYTLSLKIKKKKDKIIVESEHIVENKNE